MAMLEMGKYGVYVWSSFGLTTLIMLICLVQARRRHAAVVRDIARHVRIAGGTE